VLTLLGKPDCGLCREMRELALRVLPDFDGTLVERDVRSDPESEARYLLEIPVLFCDGTEIARHRVNEAALRQRLAELTGRS
jgi:hypothetical protein